MAQVPQDTIPTGSSKSVATGYHLYFSSLVRLVVDVPYLGSDRFTRAPPSVRPRKAHYSRRSTSTPILHFRGSRTKLRRRRTHTVSLDSATARDGPAATRTVHLSTSPPNQCSIFEPSNCADSTASAGTAPAAAEWFRTVPCRVRAP